MPEEIKNNDLAKENLIENKVREFFQKTKLNEEQIKRITKCLEKELKDDANKIKLKLKRYEIKLKNSRTIEEWINQIENGIKEIENNQLEIKKEWNVNEFEENNKIENENKTGNNEIIMKEKIREDWTDITRKTMESFSKLDNKYKSFSQYDLEQKKSELPEETKKKLAENNISEDQYVQFSIARDKIYETWDNDERSETRDFLRNLKDLEDNLWIRTETKKWLPLTASQEVFNNNPQLTNLKDTNNEIWKLEETSYFWKEKIDTNNPEEIKSKIAPYKKMEKIYKDDENFPKDGKFQDISKKLDEENYWELTNEDINYYTSKLDNLNWWITDYIKWAAAQAPLTWVLRYLDSYSDFWKDTLADRFWKWKDEYITMNNSTMRIEWIIDGNPLSFYYNIEDWNTKISCDDIIHIEEWKYEIYNWIWEYPKSDLKINMPSIKDIVNNLQDIKQEEYTNLLNWSDDIREFKSKITDLINNKIKDTYPDNQEIKTRMARFTEKNLTAQAFDSALIWDTEIKKDLNNKLKEGTEMNPLRRMILLVDNTTEKSTSSDLVELKQWFKKLEWLLWKSREELNRIKDPVARESLLAIKNAKENRDYNQREKATINFISLFEHRDDVNNNEFKMNIDDFTAFIELANKDEYTKESTLKNNFSPEFNTKYNESEIIKTENQKKEEKEVEEQNNRDVAELTTKEKNEERFDNLLEDEEIRPKEETNIT